MTIWKPGAKEFVVSVIPNKQRYTNYSYIPKPVLAKLGDPEKLKFVIRGDKVMVMRPD